MFISLLPTAVWCVIWIEFVVLFRAKWKLITILFITNAGLHRRGPKPLPNLDNQRLVRVDPKTETLEGNRTVDMFILKICPIKADYRVTDVFLAKHEIRHYIEFAGIV
jgi:hypothetical protein